MLRPTISSISDTRMYHPLIKCHYVVISSLHNFGRSPRVSKLPLALFRSLYHDCFFFHKPLWGYFFFTFARNYAILNKDCSAFFSQMDKSVFILTKERDKLCLSTIESINSAVNNFIWGVPAMICIIRCRSVSDDPHQFFYRSANFPMQLRPPSDVCSEKKTHLTVL